MWPRFQTLALVSLIALAVLPACDPGGPETASSSTSAAAARSATTAPRPTSTPFASATPLPRSLASPTPRPEALRVVKAGFGQPPDHIAVGWGAIIENPNPDRAVTGSFYRASFLDAGGREIEYDTGTIDRVEPGQRLALGNNFLLLQPAQIDEIEIEITSSKFAPAPPAVHPTVDQIRYVDSGLRPVVTALISNPRDVTLTDLWVDAVAYDDDGSIIGGGYRALDLLPAGGRAGVVVPVLFGEAPARVEVYARETRRTMARTVDPTRDPVVEFAAISDVPDWLLDGWAAVVRNPNADLALIDTSYQVSYFDAAGRVVGMDAGLLPVILPGSTTAIGSQGASVIEGVSATSIEVTLSPAEMRAIDITGTLSVSDVAITSYEHSNGVSATLENGLDADLNGHQAIALAFDEQGVLIGAGSTLLTPLPSGASTMLEVRVTSGELPARAEVYIQPGLLPIGAP
jgi:hypothetical protein